MKESHFFYIPDAGVSDEFPAAEASHAVRVLRLGVGDVVTLTDGKGFIYDARIVSATSRSCKYQIVGTRKAAPLWKGHLHIAVAPTKNIDRIEWLVEKATEIGVDEFSFIETRCSERRNLNIDRLERIVISAVKQSHKAIIPRINPLETFDKFLSRDIKGEKYIAHCLNDETVISPKPQIAFAATSPRMYLPSVMHDDSKIVMIGPEGDFTVDEVNKAVSLNYIPVSLGCSRLRTETAALYAVMMMNCKNTILDSKDNE